MCFHNIFSGCMYSTNVKLKRFQQDYNIMLDIFESLQHYSFIILILSADVVFCLVEYIIFPHQHQPHIHLIAYSVSGYFHFAMKKSHSKVKII